MAAKTRFKYKSNDLEELRVALTPSSYPRLANFPHNTHQKEGQQESYGRRRQQQRPWPPRLDFKYKSNDLEEGRAHPIQPIITIALLIQRRTNGINLQLLS